MGNITYTSQMYASAHSTTRERVPVREATPVVEPEPVEPGWALLAPAGQPIERWSARLAGRRVDTVITDPRAALAAVAGGVVAGVIVVSWDQLGGLVEHIDQVPPVSGPGPRRQRTSRIARAAR
jgi:hypothetical protein